MVLPTSKEKLHDLIGRINQEMTYSESCTEKLHYLSCSHTASSFQPSPCGLNCKIPQGTPKPHEILCRPCRAAADLKLMRAIELAGATITLDNPSDRMGSKDVHEDFVTLHDVRLRGRDVRNMTDKLAGRKIWISYVPTANRLDAAETVYAFILETSWQRHLAERRTDFAIREALSPEVARERLLDRARFAKEAREEVELADRRRREHGVSARGGTESPVPRIVGRHTTADSGYGTATRCSPSSSCYSTSPQGSEPGASPTASQQRRHSCSSTQSLSASDPSPGVSPDSQRRHSCSSAVSWERELDASSVYARSEAWWQKQQSRETEAAEPSRLDRLDGVERPGRRRGRASITSSVSSTSSNGAPADDGYHERPSIRRRHSIASSALPAHGWDEWLPGDPSRTDLRRDGREPQKEAGGASWADVDAGVMASKTTLWSDVIRLAGDSRSVVESKPGEQTPLTAGSAKKDGGTERRSWRFW